MLAVDVDALHMYAESSVWLVLIHPVVAAAAASDSAGTRSSHFRKVLPGFASIHSTHSDAWNPPLLDLCLLPSNRPSA